MSLLKRIGTTNNLRESGAPGTSASPTDVLSQDEPVVTSRLSQSLGTRSLGSSAINRPSVTQPQRGSDGSQQGLRRPTIAPVGQQRNDSFNDLKTRVQNRLIAELDPRMDLSNP